MGNNDLYVPMVALTYEEVERIIDSFYHDQPWPPKTGKVFYERDLPQQLELDLRFSEPSRTDIEAPAVSS